MAPYPGPSLEETISLLRSATDESPRIFLGRGEASSVIRRVGGSWCLSPLVLDSEAADAAAQEALAKGQHWMPEMVAQFMNPGSPLIEDADLDAFIEALRSWWAQEEWS